jgi:hypothetical protein
VVRQHVQWPRRAIEVERRDHRARILRPLAHAALSRAICTVDP